MIDTNLTGAFRVAKRAVAKMLRLHRGRIIFVSSVGAFVGLPGQANYAASKAGLVGMARALAREVASRSITVNVVAPGMVATDMIAALGEDRIAQMHGHGAAGPGRHPRGGGRGGGLPGLRRRRLHHRGGPAGRRRPGHGAAEPLRTAGVGRRLHGTSEIDSTRPNRRKGAAQVDSDAAFEKFRECAVEVLQVPADKVTKEARFADDLDADSLDLVELVMALEESFDITVEETELEDIETVGQAFDLISSKL